MLIDSSVWPKPAITQEHLRTVLVSLSYVEFKEKKQNNNKGSKSTKLRTDPHNSFGGAGVEKRYFEGLEQ